jgi:hypothetical protein
MMPIETQYIEQPHPVIEKSAIAARQGVISGRVLLVLTTSTILTVVALGVIFMVVH